MTCFIENTLLPKLLLMVKQGKCSGLTLVSLPEKSSAACCRGLGWLCTHHGSQRNQLLLGKISPVPDLESKEESQLSSKNGKAALIHHGWKEAAVVTLLDRDSLR
uniref:Uncharacterized protein n=1 Tax=Micrurus spixii TaxID=129469 RepID=A0A2D4M722_9SAUR